MQRSSWHWWLGTGLGLAILVVAFGCGSSGSLSNGRRSVAALDTSSIAGPINAAAVRDVETVPRDRFARTTSVESLIYPSANATERAAVARGLRLFRDPRTSDLAGHGPYFNQRNCLGCHMSQLAPLPATPVSRAKTEDAFQLFGDFNPATGEYNPRADAGGPVLHRHVLPGFAPQQMPPLPAAPFVRVTGLRTAPPYIGRGLMEAIPDSEILAGKSPDISGLGREGFENQNSEASSFVGGSPTVRLSRFGLRAAGTTLLQFVVGGTSQEIGLSSPFAPNANIPAKTPTPRPQPELTAQDIRDLRTLIRLIAPPAMAPIVPGSAADRGRILFGADFTQPRGLAVDRRLNCAGCHTPVMITGQSPASLGGRHLSNRRFFPFSDLLIHDMGPGLQDNALPNQGRANGRTWRTPPLMGIGIIGPPHLHDGRVLAGQPPDRALNDAIERHDTFGADASSEAYESVQAYRALPDTGEFSKADLIEFLRGL